MLSNGSIHRTALSPPGPPASFAEELQPRPDESPPLAPFQESQAHSMFQCACRHQRRPRLSFSLWRRATSLLQASSANTCWPKRRWSAPLPGWPTGLLCRLQIHQWRTQPGPADQACCQLKSDKVGLERAFSFAASFIHSFIHSLPTSHPRRGALAPSATSSCSHQDGDTARSSLVKALIKPFGHAPPRYSWSKKPLSFTSLVILDLISDTIVTSSRNKGQASLASSHLFYLHTKQIGRKHGHWMG